MLSIENSLLIHVFCQFLHVSPQYELKLWTLFPSCSPSNSAVKKWNTLVGIFENDLIKQCSLPFRRRPKHVRSWASGAADVPKRWDFALQHCFLHSFVFQSCGDHALTCLHVWRHTHTLFWSAPLFNSLSTMFRMQLLPREVLLCCFHVSFVTVRCFSAAQIHYHTAGV